MELTKAMMEYLNKRQGDDLIEATSEFRIAFNLTEEEASEVLHQWIVS